MLSAASNVDEYIARFPMERQAILEQLKNTIRAVVPEAQEVIRYGMPAFQDKLTPYDYSKGTIRFSMDKPLPLDLIRNIVRFRVEEDRAKPSAILPGR